MENAVAYRCVQTSLRTVRVRTVGGDGRISNGARDPDTGRPSICRLTGDNNDILDLFTSTAVVGVNFSRSTRVFG